MSELSLNTALINRRLSNDSLATSTSENVFSSSALAVRKKDGLRPAGIAAADSLERLPNEILKNIEEYLPPPTAMVMSVLNGRFFQIVHSGDLQSSVRSPKCIQANQSVIYHMASKAQITTVWADNVYSSIGQGYSGPDRMSRRNFDKLEQFQNNSIKEIDNVALKPWFEWKYPNLTKGDLSKNKDFCPAWENDERGIVNIRNIEGVKHTVDAIEIYKKLNNLTNNQLNLQHGMLVTVLAMSIKSFGNQLERCCDSDFDWFVNFIFSDNSILKESFSNDLTRTNGNIGGSTKIHGLLGLADAFSGMKKDRQDIVMTRISDMEDYFSKPCRNQDGTIRQNFIDITHQKAAFYNSLLYSYFYVKNIQNIVIDGLKNCRFQTIKIEIGI